VQRCFLFLQGIASPFFSRLADWLIARGERVARINFCAGDVLYWRGKPAANFNGPRAAFDEYLERFCDAGNVTDIVLFGDQRPLHVVAADFARRRGLRLHVFEEGYVRPSWVTLERGGTNAASGLLRDPQWYLRAAAALPGVEEPVAVLPSPLRARAMHDLAYHGANALNPLMFRHYRTHRPYSAALEYAGWAWRYARYPAWRRRDAALVARRLAERTPYFLLPLQLNGDYQVTRHSPFGHMRAVLEHVVASFASCAPRETRLLVKNHPLDTGLVDYAGLLRRLARAHGVESRIDYIETGHLPTILAQAQGVVTVNSTVGLSALHHARPTKVIGRAIYDLTGLTSPNSLDEFWQRPQPPDASLYLAFRKVVICATQITGDLFSDDGNASVLAGCDRLLEPQSRLEQLLERVPRTAACATRAPS
jgi:capsular polysaccharide export protein